MVENIGEREYIYITIYLFNFFQFRHIIYPHQLQFKNKKIKQMGLRERTYGKMTWSKFKYQK